MRNSPDALIDDVVRAPVRHRGGFEPVDHRPGIGVELDPEKMRAEHARYRAQGYLSTYVEEAGGSV